VLELEEPLRRTILLRYYEDLTLGAIAERTGVALPTVASRLRSAEERLRERLRGRSARRRTRGARRCSKSTRPTD